MKVRELIEKLNLNILAGNTGLDRDVEGAYCCDLLSWVMAHAGKNNAWITVQIHPNVVAVASLLELSCIIIPDSIEVEGITLEKAEQEGIAVIQSRDSAYDICGKLKKLDL